MPRWLYYLLLMSVVAPIIELGGIGGEQQSLIIFLCSTVSLIPLAAIVGYATESLEKHVGPIAGGLLNATFGNAPEIIIGIFALQHGLVSVVKASITGSIIGNILLVLGGALALGGWRWGKQYFNAQDAGQYSTMMLLALASVFIPTTVSTMVNDVSRIYAMSITIAVILLLVYALYLSAHVFGIRSLRRSRDTKHLSSPTSTEHAAEKAASGEVNTSTQQWRQPMKPWVALLLLLVTTLATAWNSELLVGTIKPVTEHFGWSQVFIGLVVIPIVGNVAEHASALTIAYKDRVDVSMAIAAGSSIQISTLVAPILVLVSLFYSTHLTLVFQPLELVIQGLAVILFSLISLDGESSWLAGVQLMAVYVIACVAFFFIPS